MIFSFAARVKGGVLAEEGVANRQTFDGLSMMQIFSPQGRAVGSHRRGNNQGVANREFVALGEVECAIVGPQFERHDVAQRAKDLQDVADFPNVQPELSPGDRCKFIENLKIVYPPARRA